MGSSSQLFRRIDVTANVASEHHAGADFDAAAHTFHTRGGTGSRDAGLHRVMTASDTANPDLGRFGFFGLGATREQAQEIERLGYGTIWVGGSPPAELSAVEAILETTTTLKVATGIVNIWTAAAQPVAESFHRIDAAYPGRFVLGVGVGHPEVQGQYRKPYEALVSYLDELDEYGVPANQRVLAAQGPRVLRLSAERTAGAHPANATPEHTAQARDIIGPNALLAPVHNVVLNTDPEEARAIARTALDHYFSLTNYINSWKRLGFTDADVTRPASDKFIDAVVAHGTPEQIAERLGEYLPAGANHVAILALGVYDNPLPILTELAGPLGLSRQQA
jgi:probable F420-dependent oxidoreductase